MSAYRPTTLESPLAEPESPSRRALLAGALGGIAALAATAIGGATRVRGNIGDPLLAGSVIGASSSSSGVFNNSDTNGTWVVTQNAKGTAVRGIANRGTGGRFSSNARNKWALVATNSATTLGTGGALQVSGNENTGIEATSLLKAITATSANYIGIDASGPTYGVSATSPSGDGVYGSSTNGSGVRGYSSNDAGVTGSSGNWAGVDATGYHGVVAQSSNTNGYAALVEGRMRLETYMDVLEIPDPAAPAANSGRMFMRDNGSGKTQLCVRFPTGAIQVLSTEP